MKKTLIALGVVLLVSGCASSFKQGVAGNVATYREFVSVMESQQNTLNSCFNAAGVTKDASALSICAVLSASTNAQQVLAGQPQQIRVPKSPEEIFESIATMGLSATVQVYGLKAVSEVMKKGFDSASKDPVVIEPRDPVIVKPEVIVVPGATP